MVITLFKSADPPIEYRANACSVAFFFRIICLLIIYLLPCCLCIFYIGFYGIGERIEKGTPEVIPENIEYIQIYGESKSLIYDRLINEDPGAAFTASISPIDELLTNKTGFRIKVSASVFKAKAFTIVFSYKTRLAQWGNNTFQYYGTISRSFPKPISNFSAFGQLSFDQTEILDFDGKFSSSSYPNVRSPEFPIGTNAQANFSALFYVDWIYEVPKFGLRSFVTFDAEIQAKEVSIIMNQPIISSLQTLVVLWVSTYFVLSHIFNFIQNCLYRNHVFKVWPIYLSKQDHNNLRPYS